MSESTTPDWFTKAIAHPTESRFVEVNGAAVYYLLWNAHETHKPGLVLAHGFRAHARWWAFIAPFLLERFRIAALDFPGMGDSGQRPHYTRLEYVDDIVGVIEATQFGRVTLVGHSFGGAIVMRTCADHPQLIDRAVVIDTFIPLPDLPHRFPPPLLARPKNIYPTLETALARFRLVPEQNCAAPFVLDFIGRHSLRQVEGGWSWKFDENCIPLNDDPAIAAQAAEAVLKRVEVPLTLVYGEKSIVLRSKLALAIVGRLRHGHGPIEIPEAHHHVLLDQPLSLVSALRAVLYG